MKKWMITVLVAVVALIVCLYVFIPNVIVIQKSAGAIISQRAIHRLLIDQNSWNKIMPADGSAGSEGDTSQSIFFNGNTYSVVDKKYSSLLLSIHQGSKKIAVASLNIIGVAKDSVKLDMEVLMGTSTNPFNRLTAYRQSKKIEDDVSTLLNRIGSFFSKNENVYGIPIWRERIIDTALVFTYDSCKGYPNVKFIYTMIDKLNSYANIQHAKITGYPMLNISTRDSISYLIKVALPLDKKLPAGNKIANKWMLPDGIMLVTKVNGDLKTIRNSFRQVEYYMSDYGVAAAAIPFLSLFTDRMQEKDSARWVTRICYPIMEL